MSSAMAPAASTISGMAGSNDGMAAFIGAAYFTRAADFGAAKAW